MDACQISAGLDWGGVAVGEFLVDPNGGAVLGFGLSRLAHLCQHDRHPVDRESEVELGVARGAGSRGHCLLFGAR